MAVSIFFLWEMCKLFVICFLMAIFFETLNEAIENLKYTDFILSAPSVVYNDTLTDLVQVISRFVFTCEPPSLNE